MQSDSDVDDLIVGPLAGRILVVENDPSFRDYLRLVLQEAGAEVQAVAHGCPAVAAATERAFNLILLYLEGPVSGGRRAVRRLRAAGVRAPIVAVTANNGFSFPAAVATDLGFDGVLSRPLDHRRLVGTCMRWLAVERARNGWASICYPSPGLPGRRATGAGGIR